MDLAWIWSAGSYLDRSCFYSHDPWVADGSPSRVTLLDNAPPMGS